MAEVSVTVVSGAWALAGVALLLCLGFYAATLDVVLAADGGKPGTALYEVARLMRQRRRTTVAADTLLWRAGGVGLILAASLMVTVVPLGRWTLADLDVGVMWFNAMDVMVWALVWLAGWGANSAHPLVGAYRFLAHGLGYEMPLMFALVAPPVAAQSLRVADVAAAQQGLWFAVWMPVAFVVYCLGVVAFSVWGPFSAALGADIAGGVSAELSGVDRLVFQAGRYSLLAAGAAFAVPMFLGGGAGPLLPAWSWVLLKTIAVLSVFVWLRSRLPVLRPEKFLEIGWMVLLPLTLVQDLVVAIIAVRS
ncbi:NADH-quinone oxidoreductase subunit H [Mycobacterium paragordonae]|uniref:complex I subunit 1 family protein n=1 Tax=Mycobacterium paragordonae TaxID=1389713 RepID=UPI00105D24BB|nr:complex I subunit 1 family protein [Mycobacterium paragordonae]TDK86574.1 NADH-quinone oxidoreductase subunit H [Mycobacterium paragordonae]